MKCLYCGKFVEKQTLRSVLLKSDSLCPECRKGLKVQRKMIDLGEFKAESFFDYDSLFRSILLQYKECHDEALKDVFLYDLSDYIDLRYHGYGLLFVPSSEKKRKERGFDHLEGIFSSLHLKKIDGLRMKEELCQEGKDMKERGKMMNNYIYEGGYHDKILIVDDMITTGSSLRGVYHSVCPYVKNIKVLSLAYKNNALHY